LEKRKEGNGVCPEREWGYCKKEILPEAEFIIKRRYAKHGRMRFKDEGSLSLKSLLEGNKPNNTGNNYIATRPKGDPKQKPQSKWISEQP